MRRLLGTLSLCRLGLRLRLGGGGGGGLRLGFGEPRCLLLRRQLLNMRLRLRPLDPVVILVLLLSRRLLLLRRGF